MYPQVSGKQNSGMSIGCNLIGKVEKTSNLGLEMSNVLKWSFHVRAKRAKAQRSFNYLQQNLPCSLPNSVKYNSNSACVLSILLYDSQAWYPDISHLRLLKKNLEGFKLVLRKERLKQISLYVKL